MAGGIIGGLVGGVGGFITGFAINEATISKEDINKAKNNIQKEINAENDAIIKLKQKLKNIGV